MEVNCTLPLRKWHFLIRRAPLYRDWVGIKLITRLGGFVYAALVGGLQISLDPGVV